MYELNNISKSTLSYIFGGERRFSNCRLSEVPRARERKDFLLRLYARAPEKNENTSRRGLTHTEILKGRPRNIHKTLRVYKRCKSFLFPTSSHTSYFFSYSPPLRAKAQIILGASCCNTLIQSQESRLLRQNRSLISTLRPCDSVMKIERRTYTKDTRCPRNIAVYYNVSRVILFS